MPCVIGIGIGIGFGLGLGWAWPRHLSCFAIPDTPPPTHQHPHGIIPLHGVGLWPALCDQYLKPLYGFGATTDAAMKLPLLRQLLGWMTAGSADRKVLTSGLAKKKLFILPGGVAEIFVSEPGTHTIIAKRHGLMKLALRTGAVLVPMYAAGRKEAGKGGCLGRAGGGGTPPRQPGGQGGGRTPPRPPITTSFCSRRPPGGQGGGALTFADYQPLSATTGGQGGESPPQPPAATNRLTDSTTTTTIITPFFLYPPTLTLRYVFGGTDFLSHLATHGNKERRLTGKGPGAFGILTAELSRRFRGGVTFFWGRSVQRRQGENRKQALALAAGRVLRPKSTSKWKQALALSGWTRYQPEINI